MLNDSNCYGITLEIQKHLIPKLKLQMVELSIRGISGHSYLLKMNVKYLVYPLIIIYFKKMFEDN